MDKNKKIKKTKTKKKKAPLQIFFQTFMMAFLLFVILCTPVRALVGGVTEYKPFNEEKDPVVEEQWETLVQPSSAFFRQYSDSKRINILLLGVNPPLTDTIMVVSFDPESKSVDIISVPRDTYYERPGYNDPAEKKLNAAYRGEAINTAKAVSEILLGIPINYYAVIEYEDVEKIVDSVGGIPIDIPFKMDYDDPYDTPPLRIHFNEGPTTLNGKDAVKYLRYRKDNKSGYGYIEGDVGRVKAQQDFMKSAFKQCLKSDILKVASTVFENVDSNITLGASASLATKAIGMKGSDLSSYTIPFEPEPEAPYYVYPKEDEIADMLTEIYSGKPVNTTDSAIDE